MTRPGNSFGRILAGLTLGAMLVCAPAAAHKEHKKRPEAAQVVAAPSPAGPALNETSPAAMPAHMGEKMEGSRDDRPRMTALERLLDWLGRLHPFIVHFPIAFFPAALFAAIVGRRRPAFAAPVQFLVVAGGVIAPIAAILGWLDAMAADPDPLLTVHRWLGTAIGVLALGLGIWTWRRPDRTLTNGTIVALSVMTTTIIVQGWYGGAMVHGIDHMNW